MITPEDVKSIMADISKKAVDKPMMIWAGEGFKDEFKKQMKARGFFGEMVDKMIEDNKDGTYTITVP